MRIEKRFLRINRSVISAAATISDDNKVTDLNIEVIHLNTGNHEHFNGTQTIAETARGAED